MSLLYLLKAIAMLPNLEDKFLDKHTLSPKMGIMVDDYHVHELPRHDMPIRVNGTNVAVECHSGFKIIVFPNENPPEDYVIGIDAYEIGNEIENPDVTPDPLNVDDYMDMLSMYQGPRPMLNPGLVSINQSGFWRKLADRQFDKYVDYIAIHLYLQNKVMYREGNEFKRKGFFRKLSDKWEYTKAIAVLLELKDKTTKPIVLTECGVTSLTAETKEDVLWMDLILNEVLGDRLKAATWYNWVQLKEYPGKAVLAFVN